MARSRVNVHAGPVSTSLGCGTVLALCGGALLVALVGGAVQWLHDRPAVGIPVLVLVVTAVAAGVGWLVLRVVRSFQIGRELKRQRRGQ